jgi:hypothetical protein
MKTKPQSEEYRAFETILGKVLTVSKAELNLRIEEEKREKRKPKGHASRVPAVRAKRGQNAGFPTLPVNSA